MPTVKHFDSCVCALLRRHSFQPGFWEYATECPVQGRHLQHESLWLYTVQVCMHIMNPYCSALCINCITASCASQTGMTAWHHHHGAARAMCITMCLTSWPGTQKLHVRSLATNLHSRWRLSSHLASQVEKPACSSQSLAHPLLEAMNCTRRQH